MRRRRVAQGEGLVDLDLDGALGDDVEQLLVRRVLGRLDSRQILTVSLLSGFGEELLFRGVIQAWLGLWPTSLLFGLFHFPVRRRLIPWSLFAAALGVVLGALTEWTRTIWPAILLHFAVNYFNIHDLVEGDEGAELPQAPSWKSRRPTSPRCLRTPPRAGTREIPRHGLRPGKSRSSAMPAWAC